MPVKETSDHSAGGKHKKKQHTDKWSQKFVSKQSYTHQWMITSLKGHTGQVQDMEFSSNGKFLATVAEGKPYISVNTNTIILFSSKCVTSSKCSFEILLFRVTSYKTIIVTF